MTNKTEWAYCPECGCEDIRHEEGEHKQCASCHQEWFSSVDYSDVVRKHLSGKYTDKDAEIERLRAQVSAGTGHVLAYKLSRQRLLGRAREREFALIGLRTKMADGIAFVQNLCNAAGSQPSVATGYLRDILDALSVSADPSEYVGPFPACPPGEAVTALEWNVLYPTGVAPAVYSTEPTTPEQLVWIGMEDLPEHEVGARYRMILDDAPQECTELEKEGSKRWFWGEDNGAFPVDEIQAWLPIAEPTNKEAP